MNSYFTIDENSRIPKYQQIVDAIINGITHGKLQIDERIPSINQISEEYYLSRDTVERAYNILKDRKILNAVHGKGFYVARTDLIAKKNVLFLVNKPSNYKLKIFNAFVNTLGSDAHVDLCLYHCDSRMFIKQLQKHKYSYDYYIVMPHFKSENSKHCSINEPILNAIQEIPSEKLLILDNKLEGISASMIYQDFEVDLYEALESVVVRLRKYKKLILIFPEHHIYPYPRRILHGFQKFCVKYELDFEILDEVYLDMELRPLDAYIVIEEDDLVSLIKQVREQGFIMGKSIGVLSYNDTPLKELLGVSVVSTDFDRMGQYAAQLIQRKEYAQVKNPFAIIQRNSI